MTIHAYLKSNGKYHVTEASGRKIGGALTKRQVEALAQRNGWTIEYK